MSLLSKIVKRKRLQRVGQVKVVLMPKLWLDALGWDQTTNLLLTLHLDEHKVIIYEDKGLDNFNEKISDTVVV